MADNVPITAGSGTDIATDEVSSVHYQKIKLALGAPDSATLLSSGAGAVDAGTPRVTLASDDPLVASVLVLRGLVDTLEALIGTTNSTLTTVDGRVDGLEALITSLNGFVDGLETLITSSNTKLDTVASAIAGSVAHDDPDSGNGSKIAAKAKSIGTNPTDVSATNDRTDLYATRAGQLITIGGHLNVISRANRILDSDGAQTDASLVGTIAGGTKIVITQIWVKADKNNSGNVAVKIGFGTANVPTPALAGVAGLIFDEDLGAGEGHQIGNGSGIVAMGGDGEELRITCDDPAGGSLTVGYSYFTLAG